MILPKWPRTVEEMYDMESVEWQKYQSVELGMLLD
jgi:hypothetical protein